MQACLCTYARMPERTRDPSKRQHWWPCVCLSHADVLRVCARLLPAKAPVVRFRVGQGGPGQGKAPSTQPDDPQLNEPFFPPPTSLVAFFPLNIQTVAQRLIAY